MKRRLLWVALCCAMPLSGAFAQKKAADDPTIMTVAGKDIPVSEFLFIAQKDSGVDLNNKKSLDDFVTLFKHFKQKVADAEAAQYDQTENFRNELRDYELQLRAGFLSDKRGEAEAIRTVYNRGKMLPSFSDIVFPLPEKTVSKDTVAVYRRAKAAYDRLSRGENYDKVAHELAPGRDDDSVFFDHVEYIYPLQLMKSLENTVFNMKVGQIVGPVRSPAGYHILRLDQLTPNPGRRRVAHILIGSDEDHQDTVALLRRANEVYDLLKKGESFSSLVNTYSTDGRTRNSGGILPYFSLGEMVRPFEEAAFALKDTGDFTRPVRTRFGYHIIKLLDKRPMPPYEEMEKSYYTTMRQGDRNFELFKTYDDMMKQKYGYVFYPEAYEELQRLCDNYFPTYSDFHKQARQMHKTLLRIHDTDIPQSEFAEYLRLYPFSTKTYSGDFMSEVYQLFVRDITNNLERRELDANHPELEKLMKEYRDGILLFNISNERVWSHPVEEQAKLEADWLKELDRKYAVKINRKVLSNLKQYIAPTSKK